jgi:hypothetical protein
MTVKAVHAHVLRLISVVKTATVLEEYSAEEQRSVVRFYGQKDSMQRIFIKKSFLFAVGSVCCEKRFITASRNFLGRTKVADDARPGRPVETATETTVKQVEELIGADRRITIDSVATALGCRRRVFPWFSVQHNA